MTCVHWKLETDSNRIAWLMIDKPGTSTNSLSRAVMEELRQLLIRLAADRPIGVVVSSAKASGFIAGADIKEFVAIRTPAEAESMILEGQSIVNQLAALPCPTVAAIHGFALGGGLEIALACRYRVLAEGADVTLGFPEVQLGVHPGFGGTVRAIQLTGPVAAMDMMLTGRSIRAAKALEMGLVDKVVPLADLKNAAIAMIREHPPVRRMSFTHRLLNLPIVRPFLAFRMRAEVAKRAPQEHYPAPYAMVDLWKKYGGRGARAFAAEARSMAELLCTPTSRNLVRVFFLQDRLKSSGKGANTTPVTHVHVIGAGVMGGDIASWCASRGISVTLQDRGIEFVAPAMERAKKFFERRYPDPARRVETAARLKADVPGTGIADADLVIEAIFESVEAKRELYQRTEPQMKADAVLATNTSSIMLETLSPALHDATRFVGLHFFNPVSRMPLIEIVRGENSSTQAIQRAQAFARQIDKLPLPCRSSPGFLVNRVLMPYLSEAVQAAVEGIPLPIIDKAATDFGMPMGPIELADVVGLDVIMSVGKVFFANSQTAPPEILQRLYDQKKFGSKSGEGFYVWKDGHAIKPPIGPQSVPLDLPDRLLLSLVNEAIAVLREQVVDDADLVDAGVIFGAGFAPFRGGPIQYARNRGVAQVVARLEELAHVHGPRFTPDSGWQLLQ
jgi:3-hydroxyacyl-CoA dehydrogenase / enoyl-CoA hydratase / 3-hydroxybutyryl-CoA epimerase